MKKRFLPLFLLPAFLIGCNTSWHSINRDKALEIANNIIQYNKHNKVTHLIQDITYLNYIFKDGEKKLYSMSYTHNMYDLNQSYYQSAQITVDDPTLSLKSFILNLTIYFVDNNLVNNLSIDYILSSSEPGIRYNMYPAANKEEARKIFENILDASFQPTTVLEQLDDTLMEIDYCNYIKEQYSDPTTYGSYTFLAKDNNSLLAKTNYSEKITAETESYVFDCNRCLNCERTIQTFVGSKRGNSIQHYTTTYDYNTPVKFIPIMDLIDDFIISNYSISALNSLD